MHALSDEAQLPADVTHQPGIQGGHRRVLQLVCRGACVDVFAPGVAILSAVSNKGDSGTAFKTGTSMAAPFVTGVVATYLETHPVRTPPTNTIHIACLDFAPAGRAGMCVVAQYLLLCAHQVHHFLTHRDSWHLTCRHVREPVRCPMT